MAYVYQHIRLDTDEVFYIGIGSDTDGKYERANNKNHRNQYWKHIVNKVGYRVEILNDDISWEEACEEEIRLIKHYGRTNINEGNLVNMTDGGEGTLGIVFTEEMRLKLRNSKKGKRFTNETKQRMSIAHRGKVLSEESRKKLSHANKGKPKKPFSEEHRRKMSEAQLQYNKTKKLNTIPPIHHSFF